MIIYFIYFFILFISYSRIYLNFVFDKCQTLQEYSMIMSERDSVHKEIEKLQDDVSTTNSKMKEVYIDFLI